MSRPGPKRLARGGLGASFVRGELVSFDKEEFFKKQAEDCRELERRAVNAEDRAFWRQAADRWDQQLREAQAQTRERHRYPQLRQIFTEG